MPPVTTPARSDRLSRPQRVAEAIKAWVVANGWRPGERLPTESDLIERFGMAKGTIREAIRILEAQGLIKSRTGPGGGVFVHQVTEERAAALLGNYFYFQRLTIDDIYQVRDALEPELAASLAGRLSAAQLAALQEVMAGYATPPDTAAQERDHHIASLRFHSLLAEYADNLLLRFLIRFTANLLSDITVARRLYEQPNRELWAAGMSHQTQLLQALRDGDAATAREVMADHMRTARRLMRLQEAELTQRFLPEEAMI